jgi:DNA-binding transcriptional LysR family regulator
VRHLLAFESVARHGSFVAAADELGYTQSAVSQQLRVLEKIVGGSLFRRHPGGRRPVEMTDTGRLLLTHSRSLLARVQATQADVEALASGAQGRIAVATIQSIGARILPGALASYRSRRPQVEIEIREMGTVGPLLDAVEAGAVDVGFSALPVRDGPFDVRPLVSDPYVLAVSSGRRERSLSDLHRQRLLGIRGCEHDRLVEERLLAEGIMPASIDRFDDNGMIQALVRAGEGMAVVPALTIDERDPGLTVHVLAELPPRQLVAVLHEERQIGPAAAEFVETTMGICAGPAAL